MVSKRAQKTKTALVNERFFLEYSIFTLKQTSPGAQRALQEANGHHKHKVDGIAAILIATQIKLFIAIPCIL